MGRRPSVGAVPVPAPSASSSEAGGFDVQGDRSGQSGAGAPVAGVAPLRLGATAEARSCTPPPVPGGGVTTPRGFRAAGVHAGFREDPGRLDLALVVADEPCPCAAVFTQNVFCSAPVTVSRARLDGQGFGTARAIMVNSGNANAATGERGLEAALESARLAADAVGCPADEVLVASTGVIGQHLPLEPFATGLPAAVRALSASGGADAARAIMTTDTRPKECAVVFSGDGVGYEGRAFSVGGMTKGSGMIMPNMATMIAVLATDAPVLPHDLHAALKRAVDASFNKVTVDSDTSTNDSCFMMASGQAVPPGSAPFAPGSAAFERFEAALATVCGSLARQMAADGEGATRLVTVRVAGAADDADADRAARAVANSPLVKTAICGRDANWGRIAAALGKSGARFRQEDAAIDIMGLPVCRGGLTVEFDEDEALRRFERPEVAIDVDLGAGDGRATVWTCDLTHEYIAINGDYRS
ncbi:bifunctional ornithine acetyltransferase/N-acetylglutamate synthase [Gordonibacter sp. An230]|nr:bifunctional ornithine acetyltransferase/N-acetylglutamate synthase [Gordonibacter sp. An230]